MSGALFRLDGDLATPTELTRGPWMADAQHGGPPSALLTYLVEGVIEPGWFIARLSVELLAPVPLTPLQTSAGLQQLSRRVAVATAELRSEGAPVAKITARLLATTDAPELGFVPDDGPFVLPGEAQERVAPTWVTGDGEATFHRDAVRYRWETGDFQIAGSAVVWHRLAVPVVEGEQPTGVQRLMASADIGSGVSAAYSPESGYGLINSDLDVSFVRAPVGEWIRTDAVTRVGANGTGLCTNLMADANGIVATGTQTLLGRPFAF